MQGKKRDDIPAREPRRELLQCGVSPKEHAEDDTDYGEPEGYASSPEDHASDVAHQGYLLISRLHRLLAVHPLRPDAGSMRCAVSRGCQGSEAV
jgi:hypothetical protein